MDQYQRSIQENMVYLKVHEDVFTNVTEGADPEDRWSRDSIVQTHILKSLEVVKERSFWHLCINGSVETGDDLYVLYVDYDTGDSFGRDRGMREYLDVFRDIDAAYAAASTIEKHHRAWQEYKRGRYRSDPKEPAGCEYTVTIKTDDGQDMDLHAGTWMGYFETFHGAEVERVQVTPDRW